MPSVTYEGIIIENPFLEKEWSQSEQIKNSMPCTVTTPSGVVARIPSDDVYYSYRTGRDSACVDIVIVTRDESGEAKVLLSKRKNDSCFGGTWWVYGGALRAYYPIADFIAERAMKECGVSAHPEVLIGVYRTMSEDSIGSTLQPCYGARVSIALLRQSMSIDSTHEEVQLFSLKELQQIPQRELHWYPLRVASIALSAMPKTVL